MSVPAVLDVRLDDNDAGAVTVRDYLKTLLRGIWNDGESFSGKRPFGNSGWEYELIGPVSRALDLSEEAARQAILEAIALL